MSVVANTFETNMVLTLVAEPEESKHAILNPTCEGVYCFDPVADIRWDAFLQKHPQASVFHSTQWLKALIHTYGYEVIAYTTSPRTRDIENAVVFCRINSWLTGRRLVSLPFSDHCEPLMREEDGLAFIAQILERELNSENEYVELRPLAPVPVSCPQHRETSIDYAFHQLDLTPALDTLFRNFHKNSIQRKIRKAESEGLTYEEGRTETLLNQFYALFERTRERHRIPPPPREWFRNLVHCFGEALKIRVAYKDGRAVAAMITLRHKDTMIYKYGASNADFHRFGAMHLLYWNAIQDAKALGLMRFDFGRTDADQQGLITFKNRWGAIQSTLTYSRYSLTGASTHFFDLYTAKWKSRIAGCAVSVLPYRLVSKFGQMLYRHVA